MGTLVREHGLQYLLAATVLAGATPVGAGYAWVGIIMKFVSRSVMTGFVNALAILIFMGQIPEIIGASWESYGMIAGGLAIIYSFPRLTQLDTRKNWIGEPGAPAAGWSAVRSTWHAVMNRADPVYALHDATARLPSPNSPLAVSNGNSVVTELLAGHSQRPKIARGPERGLP